MFFRAALPSSAMELMDNVKSFGVGTIDTQHHSMKVAVNVSTSHDEDESDEDTKSQHPIVKRSHSNSLKDVANSENMSLSEEDGRLSFSS